MKEKYLQLLKESCVIIRKKFPNLHKYDSVKVSYTTLTILGDCDLIRSEEILGRGDLPKDYLCTRIILVADYIGSAELINS